MIQLRKQGLSYSQMAQKMELSKSCVATLARKYLPASLRRRIKWTPNGPTDKTKIIDLKAQGLDDSHIAKEMRCPRYYIRQVLRQAAAEQYARGRTNCTRCTFLGDDRNPIGKDGLCLWCRLEMTGVNLLEYHESGAALQMLQAQQREC